MSGNPSGFYIEVVHTVNSLHESTGGPARTVTTLASHLADHGVDVAVIAIERLGCAESDPVIRPASPLVNLILVPDTGPLKKILGYFLALRKRLADGRAVILHDHGLWLPSNVISRVAALIFGAPYVLSARGMLEPWALMYKGGKKRWAWFFYQRWIVESASVVVATSVQECESVKRICTDLPVAVIPNGVAQMAVSDARQSINESPRLLFLSRIHPKKNVEALIHAWAEVCKSSISDKWGLDIAGPSDGQYENEMKRLVLDLGLQDRVRFLGKVADGDKATVYKGAAAFVLPSFSENFGMVVAEALAAGLPVITTTGTPWAEICSRGCGWWVEPSVHCLQSAILEMIRLPINERVAMGKRGAEFVRQEFGWDQVAHRMHELYRWIYAGKPENGRPHFIH